MSELRESVEPSVRAGTLGVDTFWVGAGFSASPSLAAGPPGLVLRGDRGDSIESAAFSPITAGARWRCPFGLADPLAANGPMIFS
jgi:hypothetical protein